MTEPQALAPGGLPAPRPLNPLTLPLQGSQLVEASAGTGKTWTIAALYLRLVLGHGGPGTAAVRPLLPGEVLVMSFTKAATRELSDRIRLRLVQAAACFRGTAPLPPGDDFLAALLQDHPEGPLREQAAWRLALAAEAMDDAAVFTIDAWCQRMLREHAFDSGCLFDEELQADEAALRDEAVRDYWRQQVYPLAGEVLALALATWPDVDALARDARQLVSQPLAEAAPAGSLADVITTADAQRRQALAALKHGWAERTEAMRAWLQAQLAPKVSVFNRRKLQPAKAEGWLDALRAWALDEEAQVLKGYLGLTSTALDRLTPAGLQDARADAGATMDIPPEFAAFEALLAALPALPRAATALRAHAAAQVQARLQVLKQQAGRFGFADMLQRLNDALDEALQGAAAGRLRERIVAQYPVALIDEFQDTSPVQLSIFNRLYGVGRTPPGQALLLIGDPKQAIYAFRGADIHSYLQARRATAGHHHVLGTNHRSSVALVAAVNACFERAEQRAGAGAFLYRGQAPAGAIDADGPGANPNDSASELPFLPVAAVGRPERWVCGGHEAPALVCSLHSAVRTQEHSRELFAALCAQRIVTLLNDAQAGFEQADQTFQRLRPADIAVLVRTGKEAAAVRAALRQRGVATVYLSDKDSVFASAEAHDLLRLLQAVAAPRDLGLARAALATALLNLPLPELLQLAQDDNAFDERCATLAELQAVWQGQGVLAMLRRALHRFGLPARWLADAGGERRLTNVLHLAELLQTASATLEGEAALLRWLAQQLDEAENQGSAQAGEDQVLRLESDADLVKVVTIHKSKGLEYPLVFLPYATHCRVVDGRRGEAVWLPDEAAQGQRRLCLAPDAAQVEAADAERLREDLRLLYVALTRARHQLWVGVAALQRGHSPACIWHRSAWGSLVSGPEPRPPEALAADMQKLASEVSGLALQVLPLELTPAEVPCSPLQRRETALPLRPAPAYTASFDRRWTVSSYSALVRDSTASAPGQDQQPADVPLRLLRDDEPAEVATEAADVTNPATPPRALAAQPWHQFPRGAYAGNFLHDQLEWLAAEGFALQATPALQQALQRRCVRQGWGHRSEEVLAWLQRACGTVLPPLGVALDGLDRALPEMEFWLPSDGLDTRAIDQLCHQHLLPGRPRPALAERHLRGLLMGFADLVYAHGGRYGVLDYKSNALGPRDADYTAAAMEAAMLQHRYDVQAALYLLALHRLLRSRLGAAYRPAQQLHGALYFFLRGVATPLAGAYHLPAPLALMDALDALLPQGLSPQALARGGRA
ncbi:exodeoxyribonuclease V subunit beta [beta proteobacterium AAP51]|nr:exodeoxyribonuclease V subunit beta [beta proteobacterium AAP51]